MSNVVSVFSLDSRMVKAMLHPKHEKYFSSEYPIFYNLRKFEDKAKKLFSVKSAIDIAIQSN